MRIPPDLLEAITDQAHRMDVSANTYILMALRNFYPYQETVLRRRQVPASYRSAELPDPGPQVVPKVGRNQMCPCGSGKKYKVCHGAA